MTAVTLPVPSTQDRLTFASKNSVTGAGTSAVSERASTFHPRASYAHGNSLTIVPSPDSLKSISMAQVVTAHVSATHNYVVKPSVIFANAFEGMIKPLTVPNGASLSRSEKLHAFISGATSIFALGGKRPKTSSEQERDARIASRRAKYRRYIGGREN